VSGKSKKKKKKKKKKKSQKANETANREVNNEEEMNDGGETSEPQVEWEYSTIYLFNLHISSMCISTFMYLNNAVSLIIALKQKFLNCGILSK
jgi:hypothetical protein